MNTKLDKARLWLVVLTPWWVLRCLWKVGLVERTTVFRWEMNVVAWRWETA